MNSEHSQSAGREFSAWWTVCALCTHVLISCVTLVHCKPHTHTRSKLSLLYLWKMKWKKATKKTPSILPNHLQILAPHKRASVLASLHLPTIFQMEVKLTQRRRWLVSAKRKDCYHPKTHPHTQRFYTWQCQKRHMDTVPLKATVSMSFKVTETDL